MIESLLILLSTCYLPFSVLILLVLVAKVPRRFKAHVFLYAVVFGMIAYCYEPMHSHDLYRYFQELDRYRTMTLLDSITTADDGLIVKTFVFWLISKTGDNHILPLLSMSIVFGVSAYITADSVGNDYNKLWKILLFQLLFIPFLSTLSNVRNVSAFALIILAVYRDLVHQKRNIPTLLLYIAPCFIHMTGFVMLLIRIMIIILKKHPFSGVVLTIGVPTDSIAIFERVGGRINIPGNIGKIITRVIWKAYASSVNTSDYALRTREGGYFTACRFLTLIMFSIILYVLYRQLIDDNSRYRNFKIFIGILMGITLVWITIGTVKYWIFAYAVIICCAPILTSLDYRTQFKTKMRPLIKPMISLLLLARFGLEVYYISQRIDIKNYLGDVVSCSLWMIVFNAAKQLFVVL